MVGQKRSRSSRQGSLSLPLPSRKNAAGAVALDPVDDACSEDQKKLFKVDPCFALIAEGKEDHVITLNVGGSTICTLHSTLVSSPSNFIQWIENNFKDFDVDDAGRPFFDRDPVVFNHILNFFRGYGMPEDTDVYPFLAEDAKFYGVEKLMKALGCFSLGKEWKFLPGPGVHPDRKEFSTTSILGICGPHLLPTLETHHFISFSLEKVGTVEVGVIAANNIKEHLMLVEQDQAVGYRSTGELLCKIGADVQYDTSQLGVADKVTVRVEFVKEEGFEESPTSDGKLRRGPRGKGKGSSSSNSSEMPKPVFSSIPSTPLRIASSNTTPNTDGAPLAMLSEIFSDDRVETSISHSRSILPSIVGQTSHQRTYDASIRSVTAPSGLLHSASSASFTRGVGSAVTTLGRYSAKITLETGMQKCDVNWPAPVPPLCFAASMCGSSCVSIIKSSPPLSSF